MDVCGLATSTLPPFPVVDGCSDLETGVATDGQPQIELRYVWQSTSDVNVELGVSALFVGTCLAGVLACTAVFYDHRKDLSRWLHDME